MTELNVKNLRETLDVLKVVDTGNKLESLHNIRMDFVGGKLTITGTNLTTTISREFTISPIENQSFIISRKSLDSYVRSLDKNGEIWFEIENKKITFFSKVSKRIVQKSITTHSIDSFPVIPIFTNKIGEFTWDKAFIEMMKDITPFAGRDDYRPALNGIYLDFAENSCVATDGRKMGIIRNCSWYDIAGLEGIIIPNIYSVMKRIKNIEDIEFSVGEKYLSFVTDDWECFVRLIEGPFPPYKKVIPTEDTNEFSFTIEKDDLGLLKKSNNNKDSHQTVFQLREPNIVVTIPQGCGDEEGNTVIIKDSEVRVWKKLIQVGTYDTEEVEANGETAVAFNIDFFVEVCNFIEGDTVTITGGVSRAAVMESENRNALLMTIRMPK